jgi:hypothetical protein
VTTLRLIMCEQGSPEWHSHRCGRVTGSRICDVVRKGKGGAPSKMRDTYGGEIIAERLSGVQSSNGFVSPAMQWGSDTEAKGRGTYAFMRDVEPVQIGFAVHPTIDMAGASPDSLIGENGGIEIKCPNTSTHLDTLLGAPIDPDYLKQMQWNMACTARAWWDFVSFDPRLPPAMQLHVHRVHRDDALIRELESAVRQFLCEIDEKIAALNARFGLARAA